ncbi:restriction endonuclease subunit S [Streptomyces griseoluteus]|uniref:restriction endonuclease subunit S n=1 Tax=Streptomyces griseoluteus TaxID=29306 RepID=UPI0034475FFC
MTFPTTKLKWVATTTAGGTPSVAEPSFWSNDDETGLPWVSIGDMSGREGVTATGRRVTDEGISAARLPVGAPGTLLLSMYASLGHTAFLKTRASWNQAILGIDVSSSYDVRFVKYALDAIKPTLTEFARSNTQANLNAEQVGNLALPDPPLETQRRIADFLDAESARIDRLTQLRRTQVATLEQRYITAISELTTPGISTAHRRSAAWPWLPEELATARLGYLARVQSGVTVHGARAEDPEDAVFPYLRVANVQGERVDLTEIKQITIPRPMAMRSMLQPGDVVMTEANGNPDNLGRGAVWHGQVANMVHQNHVFAIRVDREKLIPEYLSALLATSHGRRYFRFTSTQVGIATTSSSKVLDFPVPVRTTSQQAAVVGECDALRLTTDRTRSALTRQLGLLAERRQALITAAVTGQFDVSTASGRNVTEGVSA